MIVITSNTFRHRKSATGRAIRGCQVPSRRVEKRLVSKALEEGFSLIELIVATAILMILCGMVTPLARFEARREKERVLRNNLRELREAIDRYEDGSLSGKFFDAPSYGYPPDLQALVKPIGLGNGLKLRLLREIPVDPMTGNRDWGVHSMEDDPQSDSWDGNQIWDVYSKSSGTALDGTRYRDW